ncbi:MAG: hypothetical protein PHG64_08320 [Paludibacter sp.]|nr:hypothetical protein [Paludibacter sp.]
MYATTEKIVNVHIIDTTIKIVQDKSLVMPESKGKYDIEKIVELLKPKVPFVDPAILAILIRTFNEKVIELASEGLPDELPAGNYEITVVTCYCGTKRLLTKPTNASGQCHLYVLPSPKSNIAQQ